MNWSPAICSENRVQRWQSTQRSRSSSTSVEIGERLGERPLLVDEPGVGAARAHRLVLQRALAALVADRAVQRVVDAAAAPSTPCCAFSATGEVSWVLTTMPSATVWCSEACGLGIGRPPISTSTRHCRQAPTGSSSGWSQNRGIDDADPLGGPDDQLALGRVDLDAVDGQPDVPLGYGLRLGLSCGLRPGNVRHAVAPVSSASRSGLDDRRRCAGAPGPRTRAGST